MKYYLVLFSTCIFFTQCKKANTTAHATDDTEFLNYTLDGVAFHFDPVADTFTVTTQPLYPTALTTSYISCFRRGSGVPSEIILTCAQANPVPGIYPFSQPGEVNGLAINPNSFMITETSYASVPGEYFEGSFSGSFTDGTVHSISGSFRAKRNYP